ncbi:hypothetical protein T492DRAFT_907237 [Pavlovales sp. CCMP2436]|nr:hypothetical protein T492DRAFT_907237 [Pavlovales sp. CCMP2436]
MARDDGPRASGLAAGTTLFPLPPAPRDHDMELLHAAKNPFCTPEIRDAIDEAGNTHALGRALWALLATAALAYGAGAALVWLHAAGRLSAFGSALLHLALAVAALRHPLALVASLTIGGVAADRSCATPRSAAAPLRALRLASGACGCVCALVLALHLPVPLLAAGCGLLGCVELQAAAWAAMLLARPQPGGLLAWLPRPWLAAACTVDPLAVLEWSSEQACESWALLELWWGAVFIGLSRAEIDDALHAGALPRSLHRWLHRPLFAQLPPALLDALTADPAARARAAIGAASRRILGLPRATPASAAPPPTPATPEVDGAPSAGAHDCAEGRPARAALAPEPHSPEGRRAAASGPALPGSHLSLPDAPASGECASSSSSERSSDGHPHAAGTLAALAEGGTPADRWLHARPSRPGGGGLLVNSTAISALLLRVVGNRLGRHASWKLQLLRARATSARARKVVARLLTALAIAAALVAFRRGGRARQPRSAGWGGRGTTLLAVGALALAAARGGSNGGLEIGSSARALTRRSS